MRRFKGLILAVLIFAIAIGLLLYGLNSSSASNSAEDKKRVSEAITAAVVKCYSIEGRYPESIKYLQKNYGLHINTSRYEVHYNFNAANMMPDIQVFEWGSYNGQK